jgi:hypothetical protein
MDSPFRQIHKRVLKSQGATRDLLLRPPTQVLDPNDIADLNELQQRLLDFERLYQ